MNQQIIVETDVAVPMRDGTILRADVYRPAIGASPTLIERTPYSKDQLVGTHFVMNPMRAAKAGYAVVIQDVRGRFRSAGDFYPFVNEGLDGYDTVEWAATQSWSTGKIGMFGSSYMAAAQWQAAMTCPPHLTTIAPFQASADFREGRTFRNGAFELGSLLSISMYALASGEMSRLPAGERAAVWNELRAGLEDIAGTSRRVLEDRLEGTRIAAVIPYFFDWMDNVEPGPYWDAIDVTRHYGNIDLPVLHLSCWFDQFLVGTIRNYEGMREGAASAAARENQHLFIGPWGHYAPRTALLGTARIGELDLGISAVSDLDSLLITWFDRWLKEIPENNGRPIAPVRFFVTGSNTWRNLPIWPPRATPVRLFMRSGVTSSNSIAGDGRLDIAPPVGRENADHLRHDPDDPVPTCGGAHLVLESSFPQGATDQRDIERRNDVLVFTSDELDDELVVVGRARAHVTVTSTASSADVVVTVTEVHGDGRSLKICDGVLRTSVGSEPTNVVVDLGYMGHCFRAGQRIRVQVAASNFPRYDLNPVEAAELVVFHDASCQSWIELPRWLEQTE